VVEFFLFFIIIFFLFSELFNYVNFTMTSVDRKKAERFCNNKTTQVSKKVQF